MKCMVPETGITINPIGELVLCCAGDNIALGHIKDIDDVSDFFNSDLYNKLRIDFKNQNFPEQCEVCKVHYNAGRIARFNSYNRFDFPTYEKDIVSTTIPIRFLEITTSNICNQMCVTCSGKYSSKWAPYEQRAVNVGLHWRNENHKFHTELYKMSTNDVDKILKLIPDLQHLIIKGGEPFADPNNIKILKSLSEVNPKCRVEICTNFQLVTDYVIDILHKIDEVHIQASIDGTYELYDWIRGGNFEKTINNIERYCEVENREVIPTVTVSIYNWMNLVDLIDFFKDIKGVPRIAFSNVVVFPEYCSPLYLNPNHIKEGLDKFRNCLKSFYKVDDSYYKSDKLHVSAVNNIDSIKPSKDYLKVKETQKRMMEWIDFCLISRFNNEDIFELAPYLKEYKNIS